MSSDNKPKVNMRITGMRGPRNYGMVEKPKDGKKTLLQLLKYFSRELNQVILLVLVVIVVVLCSVFAPSMQSRAVDTIAAGQFEGVNRVLIGMI